MVLSYPSHREVGAFKYKYSNMHRAGVPLRQESRTSGNRTLTTGSQKRKVMKMTHYSYWLRKIIAHTCMQHMHHLLPQYKLKGASELGEIRGTVHCLHSKAHVARAKGKTTPQLCSYAYSIPFIWGYCTKREVHIQHTLCMLCWYSKKCHNIKNYYNECLRT